MTQPCSVPEPSVPAVDRLVEALTAAGFTSNDLVLNAFGSAYAPLEVLANRALAKAGIASITAQALLADEGAEASAVIGSPDRLFVLLSAGYGAVLERALVGGGPVFPIVRSAAAQAGIALTEMMIDPGVGPYALREADRTTYAVLEGLEARIVHPASREALPAGMVGELLLQDGAADQDEVDTGLLSAFEQVPHRLRAPGLQGWMGFVRHRIEAGGRCVASEAVASVMAHDSILDARVTLADQGDGPVTLEIETEAGRWVEADVAASFHAVSGMEAQVERCKPGSFGNSGRPLRQRPTQDAA